MNSKVSSFFSKNFSVYFLKRTASVVSLFMTMCLFQNCGTSESDFDLALSEYENTRAQNLPFAFDFDLDHMAYMSCEHENLKLSSSHFNFKAGAYKDQRGLKFRDSFLNSDQVGALIENKDQLLKYLAASDRNAGAGVVMSVRSGGDLRVPTAITVGGGSPNLSDAVSPILWDPSRNVQLAESRIASLLYDNPAGINYLKGLPGVTGKSFEGQLSFDNVGAQNVIKPVLEGDGYLSFTYGTSDLTSPGVQARAPSDPTGFADAAKSSVFGKGYKMGFSQFDPGRLSSPRVVVTNINGVELQNDGVSLDETWICPQNERYVIMKDLADARRRFDGAPATVDHDGLGGTAEVPNNPWEDYYDDGGQGTGGYYMEYLRVDAYDEDPVSTDRTELTHFTEKVLCPTLPDEMVPGQSEHTDSAWKRIRNILSPDEWYVYRGARYNCIVPKKDNACYGKFENAQSSTDPVVQYFASEDFVFRELAENQRVEDEIAAGNPATHTVFPKFSDCEGTGTETRFCPHILSVCYKL